MLKVLHVKNFALMEDLTIDFEPGLTVITGETGAGKSMVVDAIAALCGERIEDLSIRSDRDQVEITGVFAITPQVRELLEKSGIECGEELVVRRRSERGKKQLSFINDQLVSSNLLKEIARKIVDLVGQHENQSLFYSHNHLLLLDKYAGLDDPRAEYRAHFVEYRRLESELKSVRDTIKVTKDRIDLLRSEIEEIEKTNLLPDEEENLGRERNLLVSSEKRSKLAAEIVNELYESDASIYGSLSRVKRILDELNLLDKAVDESAKKIDILTSTADDLYRVLSNYQQKIDFSEERLEFVLARLDTISRLKKKYGKTYDEIMSYFTRIRQEYQKIQGGDEELEQIKKRIGEVEIVVREKVQWLSQKRAIAARMLEKKVLKTLAKLGMERARFSLETMIREMKEDGQDEVEFFISTNPGEDLKPLRKVASGGEISRITLSLKTILSDADGIPTVIFDEVDTGIGGRIAEAVGELLREVSRKHQIICITHLPQITIHADHHYLVEKEVTGDVTVARVTKLNDEMRKLEVARMLGGKKITRKTVEHAAEILQKSRSR